MGRLTIVVFEYSMPKFSVSWTNFEQLTSFVIVLLSALSRVRVLFARLGWITKCCHEDDLGKFLMGRERQDSNQRLFNSDEQLMLLSPSSVDSCWSLRVHFQRNRAPIPISWESRDRCWDGHSRMLGEIKFGVGVEEGTGEIG